MFFCYKDKIRTKFPVNMTSIAKYKFWNDKLPKMHLHFMNRQADRNTYGVKETALFAQNQITKLLLLDRNSCFLWPQDFMQT